ncbi:type II/IV secretion system protein [Candidatus Saccharibacteria bacterium]|jgi:type II secretory ATPase GspE/PulE/Tfp pilus assembly ATPase PilB-like protein|nr:type II/IV secretion system protein [Candidatus Saccharibacteria bacterium]
MNDDDARRLEEQSTLRRARILNMSYFDTSAQDLQLYKDILSNEELYSLKVVPLVADTYNIQFGVTNTTSQSSMVNLRNRFADQKVTFSLISDAGYRHLMTKYDPPKEIIYEEISLNSADQGIQEESVSQTLASVRSDDMLAYIVKQAFKLTASDIHLESQNSGARIRFRVDGVLHPVASLQPDKYRMLISSLASAANISTNSIDAQTGHINRTYNLADGSQVTVNLRVETVPTVHGMDCVLRLFNLKPELMQLDKLDLREDERAIISDIITHPNGLVLFVGPTGSGKTTTLYSIINELNTPERKIITLEDPVEYDVQGITQIPVDTKADEHGFATKFRAVLRLDPDVVMVGEIRDIDTAKTALQSSLTGHLVLSTYHAGSACAAFTRMLDSIGDNPLFMSAVRLVMAQRLLRKLDDDTKQQYEPDEQTKIWLKGIIDSLPPDVQKPDISNIKLYKAGSSAENPYGYSGQFAVRELLLMTPGLETELKKPYKEITTASLEKVAIQDGMITLMQDGVLRAIAGDTSLEEVIRILA